MSNLIQEIICHDCMMTIIAKKNVDDDQLIHVFESHILRVHLNDELEIDTVTRRVD